MDENIVLLMTHNISVVRHYTVLEYDIIWFGTYNIIARVLVLTLYLRICFVVSVGILY
jgi:hypothetical protein